MASEILRSATNKGYSVTGRLAPASCEGSCTSQTAISQARKVPERSGTTQNVPNNSLINTF